MIYQLDQGRLCGPEEQLLKDYQKLSGHNLELVLEEGPEK